MVCLDVILRFQAELWVKAVAFFLCISLIVGSSPSGQDIKVIGYVFHYDPRYSCYQIFLLILAVILVWLFVDLYVLVLPFEVLYYVLYIIVLTMVYFGIKGVFWTFGKTIHGIAKKMGKVQVSTPKFLTRRRRFKHIKDPNEREVQW